MIRTMVPPIQTFKGAWISKGVTQHLKTISPHSTRKKEKVEGHGLHEAFLYKIIVTQESRSVGCWVKRRDSYNAIVIAVHLELGH